MITPLPQLVDLCKRYGATLSVQPFDGPRLLFAVATVESSAGKNCAPRHENGYCRGGHHYDHVATVQWNCLAHMSYGEWQVMWPNLKASPVILLHDTEVRARLSVKFIAEVAKIASASGGNLDTALLLFALHYNGPKAPPEYVNDLKAAYAKGLPA